MMRAIACLLLILWMSVWNVSAQNHWPVLMLEVSKGVKYAPAGQSKWTKVKTPGVAFVDGKLKLNGKGKAMLYCNGAYKTVEGKGEYALREVFDEAKQKETTELLETFHAMAAAAGDPAQRFAKQLPADKAPIQSLAPVTGPVATFDLHFYWQTEEKVDTFLLKITDPDGQEVYAAEVSDTKAAVDPRKARLFPGRDYSWQVTAVGQPEVASKVKTFQMNTLGQKRVISAVFREGPRYQEARPNIQALMEAAWYEKEGWYYDAHEAYRSLLENAPENALYQRLYAAFLSRCGVN